MSAWEQTNAGDLEESPIICGNVFDIFLANLFLWIVVVSRKLTDDKFIVRLVMVIDRTPSVKGGSSGDQGCEETDQWSLHWLQQAS